MRPSRAAFTNKAIDLLLSRRDNFRGTSPEPDGRITLLTVDYHVTEHVERLIASFRHFVDPDGPVIVVQNGDVADSARLAMPGVRVIGRGINIGHGRALDLGLRKVRTQYVLICDPDSVIFDVRFVSEVRSRLGSAGVAGIVISEQQEHQRYHPICTAFDVSLWKQGCWSMQHNTRPDGSYVWDVGGALTQQLGGLNAAAVLPLTKGSGYGQVFADSFSNTYGVSQLQNLRDDDEFYGRSVRAARTYQARWFAWADRAAGGQSGLQDFPLWEEPEPATG